MTLPLPFEFEDWRVEPDRNALISSDGESRLGTRVMAVLLELAGSGGRVVLRDELLEKVWEGRAVTDDALTVAVHDLRKALGDRPSAPRFVETIPGRGYRWLVPVQTAVSTKTPAETPSDSGVQPLATPRRPKTRTAWPRLSATRRRLVLVVGLALGACGVLAAGWWEDRRAPGEEAGVRFDCGGINPEIPLEARDAYVLGLEAQRALTPAGFRQAVTHFELAAELAPDFSMAHVLLADALLNLSFFSDSDRAELSERARIEAREALALDPTLSAAHLIQGIVRIFIDWNLDDAEQDFWRAIQLDAEAAPIHERYATVLWAQGRFVAAEVRLRHALELAPSNHRYAMTLAQLLTAVGRPAEALELLPAGDMWEPPLLHHGWFYRARTLAALGREAEACHADVEFLQRALPRLELSPYRLACGEGGLAALHELWLDDLEEQTNLYIRALLSLELGQIEEALERLWQMHRERDPLLLLIIHDSSFGALADHPGFQRLEDAMVPFDPDDPPSLPATSHPSWAVREVL